MALRTSPIGITPSFSPSASSENSAKASLISASSCAVMSFSRASLDSLVLPDPEPDSAAAVAFRLGGCHMVRRQRGAQMKLDSTKFGFS